MQGIYPVSCKNFLICGYALVAHLKELEEVLDIVSICNTGGKGECQEWRVPAPAVMPEGLAAIHNAGLASTKGEQVQVGSQALELSAVEV